MNTRKRQFGTFWLLAAAVCWPALGVAQVPVDEFQAGTAPGTEELEILSAADLEELIGPIALYPDDLLAVILPAATYPLQIVEAARFLERLENDSSLKPDEDWDDSVVALTNYPEVVQMMSDDLDWTWRLGEAVVAQQTDVIKAIESFRDRAYAAGNLKSDDFQQVTEQDGAIQITPVQEDVIYVPYYEPESVVVYQPRPVYYYYPRPYPVYYYPYPYGYSFYYDYFWGVTTAFAIGWHSHHVHVWHHSYYGHPYYGHNYHWNRWWYRRPDIHVHDNYYARNDYYPNYDRHNRGDYWRPHSRRTVRSDQRLTRTNYYPNSDSRSTFTARSRTTSRETGNSGFRAPAQATRDRGDRPAIAFRERDGTATANRTSLARSSMTRPSTQARRSAAIREPAPSVTRPSSASRAITPTREPALRTPSNGARQPVVRPSTTTRQPTVRRVLR